MKGFVGVKQLSSPDELKQLLEKRDESSYYFLRWPHKVSGIVTELKEFPSPEGQMFNSKMELRWKQQGSKYEVLILSKDEQHLSKGFKSIGNDWQIVERNVHLYPSTETRFPQGFAYQNIKIAQLYFMDRNTATTHFVALSVIKKVESTSG